jgi:hypothetical protein
MALGRSFGAEKQEDRLRGAACSARLARRARSGGAKLRFAKPRLRPPRAPPAAFTSLTFATTRFLVRMQVRSKQRALPNGKGK